MAERALGRGDPEGMSNECEPEEFMTVDEVARWLRVTPSWVRSHSNGKRQPTLPAMKIGRHWRYNADLIRELLRTLGNMQANRNATNGQKEHR